MNMTKRLLSVILLLTMAVCLVACDRGEEIKDSTPTTAPTTTAPTTVPTTSATVPTTAPAVEYTYRIRVVDNKGEPVEGATIDFCLEQSNYYQTNADGWALINVEVTNGYKAHITSLPEGYEGYTFVEEYIFFAPGQTEMVLAVRPAQ